MWNCLGTHLTYSSTSSVKSPQGQTPDYRTCPSGHMNTQCKCRLLQCASSSGVVCKVVSASGHADCHAKAAVAQHGLLAEMPRVSTPAASAQQPFWRHLNIQNVFAALRDCGTPDIKLRAMQGCRRLQVAVASKRNWRHCCGVQQL